MSPTSPARPASSVRSCERAPHAEHPSLRSNRGRPASVRSRHPLRAEPIYIMTAVSSDDRSAGLSPEAAFAISLSVKGAPTTAGERPGTPAGERTSSICSCERAPQSGGSHRLVLACSCAVRREPRRERGATQLHPRTVLFSQDVSVGTPRPLLEAARRRRRPDRRPSARCARRSSRRARLLRSWCHRPACSSPGRAAARRAMHPCSDRHWLASSSPHRAACPREDRPRSETRQTTPAPRAREACPPACRPRKRHRRRGKPGAPRPWPCRPRRRPTSSAARNPCYRSSKQRRAGSTLSTSSRRNALAALPFPVWPVPAAPPHATAARR